jgi:hypothetical protein
LIIPGGETGYRMVSPKLWIYDIGNPGRGGGILGDILVLQESQAEIWDTEAVCPKAGLREQRDLTLYTFASRLQKQKVRSNPYMVIFNSIGYFTLVLHDLPYVQIS